MIGDVRGRPALLSMSLMTAWCISPDGDPILDQDTVSRFAVLVPSSEESAACI